MSDYPGIRGEILRTARGKTIVRIATAELLQIIDAFEKIEVGYEREVAAKSARILQLEANLEAAQRRQARARA